MTPRYLLKYRAENPRKPTCPYARFLRRMPPFWHTPDLSAEFRISNSDVVRFIILAMGGSFGRQEDWSLACRIFHEAKKARVIVFNPARRTWEGCDYKPGTTPPQIRNWENIIRNRH